MSILKEGKDKLRVHRYTFEPRTARSCLGLENESKVTRKSSRKINSTRKFTTNTILLATPFENHFLTGPALCVHDNMGNFQYFGSHFWEFPPKVCAFVTENPKEILNLFSKGRTQQIRIGILSDTTEWIFVIRRREFTARPSVQVTCGRDPPL